MWRIVNCVGVAPAKRKKPRRFHEGAQILVAILPSSSGRYADFQQSQHLFALIFHRTSPRLLTLPCRILRNPLMQAMVGPHARLTSHSNYPAPYRGAKRLVSMHCWFCESLRNAQAPGLSLKRHQYMGAALTWPISCTDTRPDAEKQKAPVFALRDCSAPHCWVKTKAGAI